VLDHALNRRARLHLGVSGRLGVVDVAVGSQKGVVICAAPPRLITIPPVICGRPPYQTVPA